MKKYTNLQIQLEDLWDYIASEIGFDRNGRKIQNAIRLFVKLKIKEAKEEKKD